MKAVREFESHPFRQLYRPVSFSALPIMETPCLDWLDAIWAIVDTFRSLVSAAPPGLPGMSAVAPQTAGQPPWTLQTAHSAGRGHQYHFRLQASSGGVN